MYVFGDVARAEGLFPTMGTGKKKTHGRKFFTPPPKEKRTSVRFKSAKKNVHVYVFVRTQNILMYVFLVGNGTYVSPFGTGRQLCL